ncbi:hypothetical protein KCP78_09705 [Salmonella enterica subsp. enterica]|nr:hypothetical protein KCP78_09705 [Salmonella enterica subsp. enterica]
MLGRVAGDLPAGRALLDSFRNEPWLVLGGGGRSTNFNPKPGGVSLTAEIRAVN